MEWSREHGIDIDLEGMVTGRVETPPDIFSRRLDHEKAVAISNGMIFIDGGDPVIGKIPRKRKMPVEVDLYDKINDEIIVVVEGPVTSQVAGEALARISATRAEYGKRVKAFVVSLSDAGIPDFFLVACEALGVEVVDVGIKEIITGGVIVATDENGNLVPHIDDEVKSVSNIVPGTPGGEYRDNLIVIPEMKPPVKFINSIEDLEMGHEVLRKLEVMFDPRDFMEIGDDAFMICQNLKRAAVHAIRGNEIGKNRNVIIFWSKERWEEGVQDFRCWMDFVRVMKYLGNTFNTHLEIIFLGAGRDD